MAEEARLILSAGASAVPHASSRWSFFRFAAALFALAFACTAFAAAPPKKSPSWAELTPAQQQILKPLAGDWDKLDKPRRTKWLGIAKRYPDMSPTEQKRVQDRMEKWARLTPEQRRTAREQYRKIGKLPPDKREVIAQQWEEYQQLPEEEKQSLAAEPPKKVQARKRAKSASSKPAASQSAAPPPASAPAH